MKLGYRQLKAGHAPLKRALSAARGARNRKTRDQRAQEQEDYELARRHRRRRTKEERELRRALNRSFKVQVPEKERPHIGKGCPRKLFHRLGGLAFGTTGMTPVDDGGVRSVHFAFVARGFASKSGRCWRSGEGGRAALYVTRAEGLEGGEAGWWSNIADDRNELVAYDRVSEEIERHDRANANVYISEIIALDHTLTPRQRRRVVKRICRYFEKRGLGYVAALHMPDSAGDQRNFHCHILYSLRPVRKVAAYEWDFAVSKVADINTPAGIRDRRKAVVRALNATLAAAGSGRRYTHLSNRARGLPPPLNGKLGQAATWLQRRIRRDEDRLACMASMKSALERIKAGIITAMKVDNLHVMAAERFGGTRQHISDSRMRVGSRMSSIIQAMVLRLDEPLQKIHETAALEHRLAAIARGTVRNADRRRWLDAKRLEIERSPDRSASQAARANIESQLDQISSRVRDHMIDRDRALAALKTGMLTCLRAIATGLPGDLARRLAQAGVIAIGRSRQARIAAIAAQIPKLETIRMQVHAVLTEHRDSIFTGITNIADRLTATQSRTADKVFIEQATKFALPRHRAAVQAGLADLVSGRGNANETRAAKQDRPEPLRDMVALCKAAFERLRAVQATVILVGPDRYRVDDAGLSPDELEAWHHPDSVEMRRDMTRQLFNEQQSREQLPTVHAPARATPDMRGLTKGPRQDEPPVAGPGHTRER